MKIVDIVINPLVNGLEVMFAPVQLLVLQVVFLCVIAILVLSAIKNSRGVLFLPSFWLIMGWVVIYLLPSIFFGGIIVEGLPEPSYFFFVIYGTGFALAVWLCLSPRMLNMETVVSPGAMPEKRKYASVAIMGLSALVLMAIWLYLLPFECTGGWSLLFDPERALLAREVSGKLSGVPYVWRLIGVYVNVIVPIFVFLSGTIIVDLLKKPRKKFLPVVVTLTALIVLAFLSLFLNATKGYLIPLLIVCIVGISLLRTRNLNKILGISVVSVSVFGGVFVLQGLILTGVSNNKYPLASCLVKFDACDAGVKLIETASSRGYPNIIGGAAELHNYATSVETVCDMKVNIRKDLIEQSGVEQLRVDHDSDVLGGLLTRAFKIPIQVASWYFLFKYESGSKMQNPIPILSRLGGNGNLAHDVYQRFGSIYSKGDVTSTSTAPASFIFVYSAFMGWLGFLLSIVLLVTFDLIVFSFVRILRSPVSCGVAGAGAVMAYHFLNTDFFTAIGSHGGVAFFAAALFSFIVRHKAVLSRNINQPLK